MTLKAVLLAGTVSLLVPSQVFSQGMSDQDAIRSIATDFKQALKDGDGDRALGYLHPDIRIFEGGHAETRDQYASGHLPGDMAFAAAVERTTTWSEVSADGDVAIYLSEYTTKGTFRDREIDSHGTETMVMSRTENGWKIRHIHWSSR